MHGNVSEWTLDAYDTSFYSNSKTEIEFSMGKLLIKHCCALPLKVPMLLKSNTGIPGKVLLLTKWMMISTK